MSGKEDWGVQKDFKAIINILSLAIDMFLNIYTNKTCTPPTSTKM